MDKNHVKTKFISINNSSIMFQNLSVTHIHLIKLIAQIAFNANITMKTSYSSSKIVTRETNKLRKNYFLVHKPSH